MKFLPFLLLCLPWVACSQDAKNVAANPETFYSSGTYNGSTIYTDKNLKQTSKANAVYYVEKELLGRDLVPNDANTGQYWEDRKYFKNTPIIRYIYKYRRVANDKLAHAFSVGNWEGTGQFIFDGMAFSANDKDTVILKMNYTGGKLNGEVAALQTMESFAIATCTTMEKRLPLAKPPKV